MSGIHPVLRFTHSLEATQRLVGKQTDLFESDATAMGSEIERLKADAQTKIREETEAAQRRSSWQLLADISQYAAGGSAIIIGSAIGGPAGGTMIASGVIGLAGRISHDTGLTQWAASWFTQSVEMQRLVATRIESSAFYLSLSLGAASTLWAYHVNAFAAGVHADQVRKILSVSTSAASLATRLGITFYDRKIAHLKKPLKEMQTNQQSLEQDRQQETQKMGQMVEWIQGIVDIVRKAISSLEVSGE